MNLCSENVSTPNGFTPLIAKERDQEINTALAELGAHEKRAITLAFFDGFTYSKIARSLQVPTGTVKARIRCRMIKMRPKLSSPACC